MYWNFWNIFCYKLSIAKDNGIIALEEKVIKPEKNSELRDSSVSKKAYKFKLYKYWLFTVW